jgi:4-amino-4-deoxy-L-arabinose transferase-like glycosyltransferase
VSGGAPVLASLGAAALIEAGGFALADLVPTLRSRPVLRRLGWAWLLGCAWLAGSSYAGSHVLHLPLRRSVILPLAVLPVLAAAWGRLGRRPDAPSARLPLTRAGRAFCVILVAFGSFVTVSFVADGLATPVSDWDGKMVWVAQARFIRGARTVDAPVLRDPSAWVIHPRYPVLMPVLQVASQEIVDAPEDDRFVRPLYALFWPAFLLVLFDTASARAGRLAASVATLAASCAPFLASFGAGSACSDFPLACFWGGGLLLLASERAGAAEGLASGLLLGAAVLSKGEGLPLVGVALIATLVWALAGRRLRRIRAALIVAALCAAAAAGLLASWRSGIPARYDQGQVGAFTVSAFLHGSRTRLPDIAGACIRAMADRRDWGLTWVLIPAGIAFGVRRLAERERAAVPLALSVGGAVAFYAVAYVLSGWPAAVLVGVTWSRFLVQMGLLLFVLLAQAIDPRRQPGPATAPTVPAG